MLTAGLSKHARRGCLEKLNNSMTGHILDALALTHIHVHRRCTAMSASRAPWLNDVDLYCTVPPRPSLLPPCILLASRTVLRGRSNVPGEHRGSCAT